MNIYLLIEDGESFCVRHRTMAEAVQVCEQSYLEDRKEEEEGEKYNIENEKRYYHEQILQSCSLVAKLKN